MAKKTEDLLEEIKFQFKPENIILGEDIGADFAKDEYTGGVPHMPEAVIEAESSEDISAVIKACSKYDVPVTVRGAGTGKVGGSVAIRGGIVLSLRKMNKILSFDEAERSLTVEPGVLLQDVKAEAEKHGLYYPPDPGEKTATIGGNASTNASGACAFGYGSTKDYILDAELVFPNGNIGMLSDSEDYKNIVGSEGTLAIISKLKIKLVEKPKAEAILLLPFMRVESCINAAIKLSVPEFNATVLEYLDTDMVEFSGKVTGNPVFPVDVDGERVRATLMINIEAENDDGLDEKMESVAELAEELECLDILVVDTPGLKRDVWVAHDAFHTSIETARSESEFNVNVPAEKLSEMLSFVKAIGDEKSVKVLCYSHILSGGLHVHVLSDLGKADFSPVASDIAEKIYAKCIELGGCIRAEYGYGYAKIKALRKNSPRIYADLAVRKNAFDPKNLLNPGKVTE